MRLSLQSSAKQNSQPQALWTVTAVAASMLVVAIGLYLAAWPQGATWQWVPAIGLAALIPVTLAALYLGSPPGLVVAVISSAAILPLLVRGWQLAAPAGPLR